VVTFVTVKPIIVSNCAGSSCHVNGPKTDYSVYQNAKNSITAILSRLNAGTMPPSGKLGSSTITTISNWNDDGKLEN
jgi:hypothetical protein